MLGELVEMYWRTVGWSESMITLSVFPNWHLLKLDSYLTRPWETGVMSPSIITFQRDDSSSLRNTSLGCKAG